MVQALVLTSDSDEREVDKKLNSSETTSSNERGWQTFDLPFLKDPLKNLLLHRLRDPSPNRSPKSELKFVVAVPAGKGMPL